MDILQWKANLATFYLTHAHFRDMTHSTLALNLIFIGKWPIYVEYANDVIHLHNIEQWNNTRLGSIKSLIPKPRWKPSSIPILAI